MTYQDISDACREAISDWDNYRASGNTGITRPDDYSKPMGEQDSTDPRFYGYEMVEKALNRFGPSQAWYELAKSLLSEVHCMGKTIDCYNKMHFGWNHRVIVSKTLTAIYAEIDKAIRENPKKEAKGFEAA